MHSSHRIMSKGFTVHSKQPEPEGRYRIEEEGTGGCDILRSNMTKEECREAWNYFVSTGTNPNYLKIVRES